MCKHIYVHVFVSACMFVCMSECTNILFVYVIMAIHVYLCMCVCMPMYCAGTHEYVFKSMKETANWSKILIFQSGKSIDNI